MTEIILAGQPYTIGTLTLGQMRRLKIGLVEKVAEKGRFERAADGSVVVAKLSKDELVAALNGEWDQLLEVVAAALSRDYPAMTVEALLASEATTAELEAAYMAVLRHAGLMKGQPAGEDQPGAVASPGDGSTAT